MSHQIYRFSPIKTETDFDEAVSYVAKNTVKLAKHITGENFKLGNLTIFSHYQDEFDFLSKHILNLGTKIYENNGPFSRLHTPREFDDLCVETIRIRTPDPYRLHVGCADLIVKDYTKQKEKFLKNFPSHVRCIDRPTFEMLEFFHPDFDVLSYIVEQKS